ncbi:MAG: EAL domain-containing protein [Gammaproteobacteria bacterium]
MTTPLISRPASAAQPVGDGLPNDVVGLVLLALLALALAVVLVLYIANTRQRVAETRRKAREAIHAERQRADVTLHSIADGVITAGTGGAVEYLNPVAERLTGWRLRDAQGRPIGQVLRLVDERTGEPRENMCQRCVRENVALNLPGEVGLLHRGGRRVPIDLSVAPIRDDQGSIVGTVLVFQDVSRAREMSRLLAYQAAHDDLTALVSRREFERRVNHAIESARAHGGQNVLCYLDLDQFKVVNDTCGHIAGDALLKEIAALLKPHVRPTDSLARLGGDEFGILFHDCPVDEALATAEQLITAVKRFRFAWEGKTFEIGVSIGMVPVSADARSFTQLLSFADSACYVAKEKGGGRVHVYTADDAELLKRQGEMQWVHRITRAYSERRFVLYAQRILPLFDGGSDEQRFEILLRMVDDSGQLVLPMEYIRAAERYNMIADLDRWVMTNAFALISGYVRRRRDNPSLPIKRFAINLSGQSLGDDRTLEYVRGQFDDYPDLPPSIIFEITETAAISNLAQAVNFISLFRGKGCQFALDDFGTGVSSFAYLKNLTVDYLKIDGSFVRDMAYDPVDFAVVGSVNHIGHVVGLKTIAEAVEDPDILQKLRDIGVDYGQGHLLSEPQPLEAALSLDEVS